MNLMQASRQWAERPVDERFWTLQDLRDQCFHFYETAKETSAIPQQIGAKVVDDDLRLVYHSPDGDRTAKFTNWSFAQTCRLLEMPAEYISKLPTELAIANLNNGIARWQERSDRKQVKLLTNHNGSNVLRAVTSTGYSRVWNYEVVDHIIQLSENEPWMVPPARPAFENQPGTRKATKADVIPNQDDFALAIKEGDDIAPGALFASDRDMFAFLVNPNSVLNDGSDGGLMRGIFISNSEVGAQSVKITKFFMRNVCGNLICWDASGVLEVRIVHRGATDEKFVKELALELQRYGDSGVEQEEAIIAAAQRHEFGKDKQEVLDVLFGIKNLGLTKKQLDRGFDIAELNQDTDGAPTTAWGMVQGLTRMSQESGNTDSRVKIDRAAGKLLDLVKAY